MAAKKFSVTYFLNTRLKAKDGNKYPVYMRIIFNKVTNSIISNSFKEIYLNESELELIVNQKETKDKKLKYYQTLMNTEKSVFIWIFDFLSKGSKEISVFDFPNYFQLFNLDIVEVLSLRTSELLRIELCETLQKKTGFKYNVINKMLADNTLLDSEELITDALVLDNVSKDLLRCFISQKEMEGFKEFSENQSTKLIDWFYYDLKNEYKKARVSSEIFFRMVYLGGDPGFSAEQIIIYVDSILKNFIKKEISK